MNKHDRRDQYGSIVATASLHPLTEEDYAHLLLETTGTTMEDLWSEHNDLNDHLITAYEGVTEASTGASQAAGFVTDLEYYLALKRGLLKEIKIRGPSPLLHFLFSEPGAQDAREEPTRLLVQAARKVPDLEHYLRVNKALLDETQSGGVRSAFDQAAAMKKLDL